MRLLRVIFHKLPIDYQKDLVDSRLFFLYSLFLNLRRMLFHRSEVFGQTGEDALLAKWLPESHGTYIDIGAGQPICGSNTYAFYKRGWRGICVDPIKDNCKMFRILRSKDSILEALVTENHGKINFWEFIPYEYSTTVQQVAERLMVTEGVRLKHLRALDAVPISSFAPEMNPISPTLLSIDVEGADLEVLQSNDWINVRPRVICVEEWQDSITSGKSNIRQYLESRNYSLEARTELSSIFVEQTYLKKLGQVD